MHHKALLTAIVAVALVVPLAGQKPKPPKPPVYATVTITDDIHSDASTVQVGRDTLTYGPTDQRLYIHESLLPPADAGDPTGGIALVKSAPLIGGFYGPYFGQIRVLDNRIDYLFDVSPGCVQDNASPDMCPFWMIVADGVPVYEKIGKTRVLTHIAFDEGRYLLYQKTCNPAVNPDCLVKLYGCYDDRDCPAVLPGGDGYIYATVNVWFQ